MIDALSVDITLLVMLGSSTVQLRDLANTTVAELLASKSFAKAAEAELRKHHGKTWIIADQFLKASNNKKWTLQQICEQSIREIDYEHPGISTEIYAYTELHFLRQPVRCVVHSHC